MSVEGGKSDAQSDRYETFLDVAVWVSGSVGFSSVWLENEHKAYLAACSSVDISVLEGVVERIARQAAAESVAVEGFFALAPGESRSIAVGVAGWQEIVSQQSAEGVALFESQLEAYRYVQGHAKEEIEITEHFVRELHSIACGSQDTYKVYFQGPEGKLVPQDQALPKGEYKRFSNNVTRRGGSIFWYASPEETGPEMARFVGQLRSDAFKDAHPVVQAAFAHHALTHIHPFGDGNGRVARALASYYTYKAYGVPFVVYADRKMAYFQALEFATRQRTTEFVDYIQDRVMATLSYAGQQIRSIVHPSAIERLNEYLNSPWLRLGIQVEAATAVGKKILAALHGEVKGKVEELGRTAEAQIRLFVDDEPRMRYPTSINIDKYYGDYKSIEAFHVTANTEQPVKTSAVLYFSVAVANDLANRFTFLVLSSKGPYVTSHSAIEVMRIRYEDCVPEFSASVEDRLILFADSSCVALIESLSLEIGKMLRQIGRYEE